MMKAREYDVALIESSATLAKLSLQSARLKKEAKKIRRIREEQQMGLRPRNGALGQDISGRYQGDAEYDAHVAPSSRPEGQTCEHTIASAPTSIVVGNAPGYKFHSIPFSSQTMRAILETSEGIDGNVPSARDSHHYRYKKPTYDEGKDDGALIPPPMLQQQPTYTQSLAMSQYPTMQTASKMPKSNGIHDPTHDTVRITVRQATAETAQLIYASEFSGIHSRGASGMTILEELIDLALKVCEGNSLSGHGQSEPKLPYPRRGLVHSRAAALLGPTGKVYTGLDLFPCEGNVNRVVAERAALLAATSDRVERLDCLVIASTTMTDFPYPDGVIRESLRSFGDFPVVLVNASLDKKHTSTQELFPLQTSASHEHLLSASPSPSRLPVGLHVHWPGAEKMTFFDSPREDSVSPLRVRVNPPLRLPRNLMPTFNAAGNAMHRDDELHMAKAESWNTQEVLEWLDSKGMGDLSSICTQLKVDGMVLQKIDDDYAQNTMLIRNPIKRRKFMYYINHLQKHTRQEKAKIADQNVDENDDEYELFIAQHRIALIAKLKNIFDKCDAENVGRLTAQQLEKALAYMKQDTHEIQTHTREVRLWLRDLNRSERGLTFPEFVREYSVKFVGMDDVDVREDAEEMKGQLPTRSRLTSYSDDHKQYPNHLGGVGTSRHGHSGDKHRSDREEDLEAKGHGKWRADMKNGHEIDDWRIGKHGEEYYADNKAGDSRQGHEELPHEDFSDDHTVVDAEVLVELKEIFDRFEVNGLMTAVETCQAFTEAGLAAPRRELAHYLRSRKHIGLGRKVSFFEFIRAYAWIKASTAKRSDMLSGSKTVRNSGGHNHHNHHERRKFHTGDVVEAQYRGAGAWMEGTVDCIETDGRISVRYADGGYDYRLNSEFVRHIRQIESEENDEKDAESPRKISRDTPKFGVGDIVKVRKGKVWYSGKILRAFAFDNEYDVKYDNGDTEKDVSGIQISLISKSCKQVTLRERMKVEVNYRGRGKWYTGTISAVNADGTFEIAYDDGDKEHKVLRKKIRPNLNDSNIREDETDAKEVVDKLKAGIKVEANFRGRGRYFAGTIAKVNSDGTFDIDYDNRQSEYRVHAIDIRSMERGIEKIDDDSDDDYDFDFDHDYQRGKSGRK